MSWTLVALADCPPTPWRNGGGSTRELLAWPQAGDWQVRMSVAEVTQAGPFSRFDGVQRWFAVLQGAGVRLLVDGKVHELTGRSPPFAFDGGATTSCDLLAGPTLDCNLMLRGVSGRMARAGGGRQSFRCAAGALVALYSGAGSALVNCADGQLPVAPQTLAWRILDAGGAVQVEATDALWMESAP